MKLFWTGCPEGDIYNVYRFPPTSLLLVLEAILFSRKDLFKKFWQQALWKTFELNNFEFGKVMLMPFKCFFFYF